ncbi:MAG: hypothetical protein ABIY70_29015 [Capsulimonas sp.]|uniref:hypothetical protein n=1 Tax=Capsulimonas sp. TaxID=2494211 RepID=UPI003266B94B
MNCPAKNLIAALVLLMSLTPHNADAHGHIVEAAAPDHATHIASPDHLFVTDFMIDAGTTGVLSVSVAKDNVHGSTQLKGLAQICSFMWLPKHPHTLVFSTSGVGAPSALMLFDGKSLHVLRRTKKVQSGSYILHGSLSDGRTLVYGYSSDYFSLNEHTFRRAEAELQKRRYLTIGK